MSDISPPCAELGHGGGGQRLGDIGDDVVLVLDADGKPDGFRRDAGLALFGFRHLAMGGGGGMAGQRLGVADIDQPLDQLQRVIEMLARFEAAFDAKGQQRRHPAAQIFLRQRVIGAFGKAGILHPGDAGIAAQEFGHGAGILDMALDPQRHGFDPLQQQEGAHRRQDRAGGALIARCGRGR